MEGIKIKKGTDRLKLIFWQARVNITQIPSEVETQTFLNYTEQKPVEIDKSWLYDPFLDRTIYGLEISLNQGFGWSFYLNTHSKAEAVKKGHAYLMALAERFPGLAGKVEIIPITSAILNQDPPIFELLLPPLPYNERETWDLIKKIIQLFQNKELNHIQFYIIWQRDDSVNRVKLAESSLFELYKIKIFFQIIENNKKTSELEKLKLQGRIDYLVMGIRNLKGKRASIKRAVLNRWKNIVSMNVFWVNKNDIHTHLYYHDIKHQIPTEKFPSFIYPDRVDFSFPPELPILKARYIPFENINYGSTSRVDEEISIGTIVTKGVPTKNVKFLPLHHFAHSVFIAGKPGAGKTYFLGHILTQFHEKAKNVGILILNLGKAKQEGYYKTDKILKFGSPQFHLSYFYEGEYLDRALQETACYLIAALGLASPCDKIMYSVMKAFIRENGALPPSLNTLFKGLKKWFKTYPYDDKYQTRILRALENRIPTLLTEPILDKTLTASNTSEPPLWFQQWKNGATIFIDLCMCNIYVKRLITNAIFQMVRTLTPDREAGRLENIIVIDEAHQILEESISNDPKSDEFISKEQLKLIFNHLIREFRSKGLSFFIIDNVPHLLFSCATTLPSLKFLFILDHLDMDVFTKNPQIQEYLILQSPRNALVINGNNEELFVIRTLDYQYSLE